MLLDTRLSGISESSCNKKAGKNYRPFPNFYGIIFSPQKQHQGDTDVFIIPQVSECQWFFLAKENMNYEKIEQYIYKNDVSTYDILDALHPTYRYKLYEKIKENSRLNGDCNPEIWADAMVRMLPRLRKEIVESFELVSYSYLKLLEIQRITKSRLTRKANRARTNLRKALGFLIDEDDVQQRFDNDQKKSL
ncbi:hypothetical protein [Acetobacter sp. AAB5]|uniref:hypothetical protein n=1 Tax=Acetobacter sp. AAB5 TaxID=3418370 RepID=UPI003CF1FC7E